MALYIGVEVETDILPPYTPADIQAHFDTETTGELHGAGPNHHEGVKLYVDTDKAEVCTAPLRIEKGVSTRLARRVKSAQKTLDTIVCHTPLRGHSMHWNITYGQGVAQYKLMPVQEAFGLMTNFEGGEGTRIERKPAGPGYRIQQRTDYLAQEEEIIAFAALMLGIATDKADCVQDAKVHSINYSHSNTKGRTKQVKAHVGTKTKVTRMSALDFLQTTYEAYEPSIDVITTPKEKEILEEYVKGKKIFPIEKAREEKIALEKRPEKETDPLKELYGHIAAGMLDWKTPLDDWTLEWWEARAWFDGQEIELKGLEEMETFAKERFLRPAW